LVCFGTCALVRRYPNDILVSRSSGEHGQCE
jgi:hypothetical protein